MKVMKVRDLFTGNDMRTANGTREAVEICLNQPQYISELFDLIENGTKKHKMCAADCLEKLSVQKPELLFSFAAKLFEIGSRETQQEVRWHIAQIAPRLEMERNDAIEWVSLFKSYLDDKSKIVVTFAMNAIWEISKAHNIEGAREIVENLSKNGAPSVKARARQILGH